MKRIALLIAALLIVALPALADEQLDADRRLVETLFAAAAGTTADAEKTARADMTDEEAAARTQALADDRRLSEIWLIAALAPDPEIDATPAPTAAPAPEATPAPTLDEAFYALSENEIGRAYLNLLSAQDAADCLEEARAKSNFLSAVEVRPGDHLVTLSTCAYAFENARYIAIGRLNEVEPLAVPIEE